MRPFGLPYRPHEFHVLTETGQAATLTVSCREDGRVLLTMRVAAPRRRWFSPRRAYSDTLVSFPLPPDLTDNLALSLFAAVHFAAPDDDESPPEDGAS